MALFRSVFTVLLLCLIIQAESNASCAWCKNIKDEDTLLDVVHTLAMKIEQIRTSNVIQHDHDLHINLDSSNQIVFHASGGPVVAGLKLLEVMYQWYDYRIKEQSEGKVTQQSKAWKLSPTDSIEELLSFIKTAPVKLETFTQINNLLQDIFDNDEEEEKFRVFFRWIFYIPYTEWVSNNRLRFIKMIGSGQQGIVFKVADVETGEYYALKLFEMSSACNCEEAILLKIEREIFAMTMNVSNFDDSAIFDPPKTIYVARMITDYGITCNAHSSILMQYIAGAPVYRIRSWSKYYLTSIITQIGDTIKWLASKGIGNFDINLQNILVDKAGNFWLIDFDLGMMINNNNETENMFELPIIGTWMYYSPSAYELDMLLRSQPHNIVLNDKIKKLIENANMYSLQALLLHTVYRSHIGFTISNLCTRCHEMWDSKGNSSDIPKPMVACLSKMWQYRSLMAIEYLNPKRRSKMLTAKQLNLLADV